MAKNPLARLPDLGQSIWLDYIRRDMVQDGTLARMIATDELRGMTSNPTIFAQAISGSSLYDGDIRGAAKTASDEQVFESLAIADIRAACDVFRPVYDKTKALDGYVSLEVSPTLARNTAGTTADAARLWKAVDRPNLMIKIPGTAEGLPAIEASLAAGINVNVTLLFAVEQYEKVMHAFIAGLDRRRVEGLPLDVHSVASFFVSRVDTEVDARLGDNHPELHGKAGVANARAAYQAYERIVGGEPFAELRAERAAVQRPLWASTGVKNPAYSPVLYVDELAGPDTVNTMPLDTLRAAGEHSEVTEPRCTIDPSETLAAIAAAGIDLDDVTDTLLKQGVDKFVEPMESLLAGIEQRRAQVSA